MPEQKTIKVLLIEDDPDDSMLIQDMLREAEGSRFEFACVKRLSKGLDLMGREAFDVVILDLSLPDSQGVETVGSARFRAPHVPIIVLTGLDDQTVAMKSLRSGAQDYLIKNKVSSDTLARSIRYAMERQRLERELERAQQVEGETWTRRKAVRDYHHFVAMSEDEDEDSTQGPSLPEPDTGALHELLPAYRDFVVSYVRTVRQSEDRPVEAARKLARRLAKLRARARDVIRLHLCILTDFSQRAMPAEYQSFSTPARFAVLELLGQLTDAYLEETLTEGEDEAG